MEKIKSYFNGFSKLKWLSFIALSLLVLTALEQQGERLYWKYGFFEPLIIEGNIKIINPYVAPGDTLYWQMTYTKKMAIIPNITCQLINHIIYTVTVDPPVAKPLNVKQTCVFPLVIPRSADYGQYKMVRTYRYPVGPDGRIITKTVESEPFWVEPSRMIAKGSKGDKGDKGETGKAGKAGKNFWGK